MPAVVGRLKLLPVFSMCACSSGAIETAACVKYSVATLVGLVHEKCVVNSERSFSR